MLLCHVLHLFLMERWLFRSLLRPHASGDPSNICVQCYQVFLLSLYCLHYRNNLQAIVELVFMLVFTLSER